jgi:hypothetical protein
MSKSPTRSAKNERGDYDRFESFMKRLMAVPHSEIKAKLDAEKAAKTKRRSKRASHASGVSAKED